MTLWRACTTANKYLVSHLGFLLVASPEPEILHKVARVHYRKFMFIKVTVWKSSCLEKSLFGNSQIVNGMALTGHRRYVKVVWSEGEGLTHPDEIILYALEYPPYCLII